MPDSQISSYRDLIVWQRAIETSIAVYRFTSSFPREEVYGLTSQIRRASVSVASNIAEGYGRLSRDQYRHFLTIANGSNFELQTQLVIAKELGMGDALEAAKIERMSLEVSKMLVAMLKKLRSQPAAPLL
ncbi:MAG TPA: four helix bundle protein [Acidobacteriaceae bacterium]|nr:four helix bundle protein [Acidobacteriaceae bacterium]